MIHQKMFFIASLFLLPIFHSKGITPSIGLCYESNSGNFHDWGSLKIISSINHPIQTSLGTFTPEMNVLYNNVPGLLENKGHLQLKIDVKLPQHTNPATVITKDLLIKQINETIDYNPEKNKYLQRRNVLLQKLLENNFDDKKVQHKEILDLQEKTWVVSKVLYDETNPDVATMAQMLQYMKDKK